MDISTIIFILFVSFFCWRGYKKGFIGSITRVLSWIVAYPAAIFFTKPFAKILIQHTALDGIIVYFLAGVTIFLFVSGLVTLVLNAISQLTPDNDVINSSSKLGGASVGIIIGSVIGLLTVYAAELVKSPESKMLVRTTSPEIETITSAPVDGNPKVPHIHDLKKANDTFIEASAKKLVSNLAATAVGAVIDDKTTTQITKAFAEDPQTMISHVQEVNNNGQIKKLLADEKVQSLLITGDVAALVQNQQFKTLMNDEHMQAIMGTADNSLTGDNGQRAAAEKMITAWRRVETLKHDPRVIAIISDPEFQQQLNSPNKLSLMMNPKLNQLTEIIFNSESPVTDAGYLVEDVDTNVEELHSEAPNATQQKKPKTSIYRWTDENGQIHYSDKPEKK